MLLVGLSVHYFKFLGSVSILIWVYYYLKSLEKRKFFADSWLVDTFL